MDWAFLRHTHTHTHSVPHQIIILLVLCRFFSLFIIVFTCARFLHAHLLRQKFSVNAFYFNGWNRHLTRTHTHSTNQNSLCNFMKIRFYAKIWMRFAYFRRLLFVVFIWLTSALRMLTTTHPICPVSVNIRLILDELSYNPFDDVGNVMITTRLHSHALS